jgi:hypothetical protein
MPPIDLTAVAFDAERQHATAKMYVCGGQPHAMTTS